MKLNSFFGSVIIALLIGSAGARNLLGQQEAGVPTATVDYARPKSFGAILKPFLPPFVPETSMANSPQVRALIRDGKMELSIEDALMLALENNLDIVVASYEPAMAQTDFLRAKGGGATRGVEGAFQSGAQFSGAIGGGVGSGSGGGSGGAGGSTGGSGAFSVGGGAFDPSVGFSYVWNQNTQPLGIQVVNGVPVVTTHTATYLYSFGQSFTTGTSYGIYMYGERQSTNGTTSLFNPQVPTQMAIGFTQPLLNGFGRGVNARFIRIARNEMKIADSSFRQNVVTTLDKVLNLYWDVVSACGEVSVAQKALDLAEKTLSDTSKEVQLGVIARFEQVRASAEVARQRQSLIKARSEAAQQQEQLKTMLSKHVDHDFAVAEIVPTGELPEPRPGDVPALEEALRQAAANRPEIEQADLNLRNQDITIKAARNALLPSLGIYATYAPQGLSGNGITRDSNGNVISVQPGGLSDSLSQTFRNQYPDYTVGVSLSIPLRNRTAQADLARTLIEQRQLEAKMQRQKEVVEEDVRRAVISVNEAKAEIEASQASVSLAQQTLDGEQKKFQLGESDVFRIVQAQRDLATAEDEEVTARANYAKALVEFAQATGTLLEKHHIEIGDAKQERASRASDLAAGSVSQ